MNPTAKRCLTWGIVLCVVGALAMTYVPELYAWLVLRLGEGKAVGIRLLDVILSVIRWTAFPFGSALIAAAILIEVLLRELPARLRQGHEANVSRD